MDVANRLLDGFVRKIIFSKYARPAACSPSTALCDIKDLRSRGVWIRDEAGGRGTSYRLAGAPPEEDPHP